MNRHQHRLGTRALLLSVLAGLLPVIAAGLVLLAIAMARATLQLQAVLS